MVNVTTHLKSFSFQSLPGSPPHSPHPYDYEDFPYMDRTGYRSPYPTRTQSIMDLRRSESYNLPRRTSMAELNYRRVSDDFIVLFALPLETDRSDLVFV